MALTQIGAVNNGTARGSEEILYERRREIQGVPYLFSDIAVKSAVGQRSAFADGGTVICRWEEGRTQQKGTVLPETRGGWFVALS